jgi:hypothetical protein
MDSQSRSAPLNKFGHTSNPISLIFSTCILLYRRFGHAKSCIRTLLYRYLLEPAPRHRSLMSINRLQCLKKFYSIFSARWPRMVSRMSSHCPTLKTAKYEYLESTSCWFVPDLSFPSRRGRQTPTIRPSPRMNNGLDCCEVWKSLRTHWWISELVRQINREDPVEFHKAGPRVYFESVPRFGGARTWKQQLEHRGQWAAVVGVRPEKDCPTSVRFNLTNIDDGQILNMFEANWKYLRSTTADD